MIRLAGPVRVALAGAAILGSLSLVAWRQGQAFDELEALEQVREGIAIREVELIDLTHQITALDSRERVRREAELRLGLRPAQEHEMRFLGEGGR